ncbi:hypothetical protein O5853_30945, partial [Escherichia coli]|nr:hypothetical protein [Escherichia coli]
PVIRIFLISARLLWHRRHTADGRVFDFRLPMIHDAYDEEKSEALKASVQGEDGRNQILTMGHFR